mmetsp:Transcript_21604/g.40652  ORF Transcript_21604/g.40652 Transcript_21604/m.40652 type:complete len:233 (-) Transcript_21604:801-1499(-)
MSLAASCLPPFLALSFLFSIPSPSSSHSFASLPISAGSLTYFPHPSSSTRLIFPSSCPGRKLYIMMGSPQTLASAMLPGPALVTIKSAEFMYDGIEGVYPVTRTSPLEPCRPSRFFFASALLPQITVTLARPLRLEMHALAVSTIPPMPSPPPTINTLGLEGSRLRSVLYSALSFEGSKPDLMGKPMTSTFSVSYSFGVDVIISESLIMNFLHVLTAFSLRTSVGTIILSQR